MSIVLEMFFRVMFEIVVKFFSIFGRICSFFSESDQYFIIVYSVTSKPLFETFSQVFLRTAKLLFQVDRFNS